MVRRSRSSIAWRCPTRRAGSRPERIQRRMVSGFFPTRSAASATVSMHRWYVRLRTPGHISGTSATDVASSPQWVLCSPKAQGPLIPQTVTLSASKKPWDQRLTERWARQAEEAANDPTWRTVSWRDQVKSPWYWGALPAMGLFFVFGGFRGVGAIFYVIAIALVQMSRRAARRKASS
jgi:hypothetical protein